MDSLLSKEVPSPEGYVVELEPPSCPAGGFAKPQRDCWGLKRFLNPLNRTQQCPSPHPEENRNGERQGKRVSHLWILDILGYFEMPRRHTHTQSRFKHTRKCSRVETGMGGMLGPCMAVLCHRLEQLPIQALQCLTQSPAHRKGI